MKASPLPPAPSLYMLFVFLEACESACLNKWRAELVESNALKWFPCTPSMHLDMRFTKVYFSQQACSWREAFLEHDCWAGWMAIPICVSARAMTVPVQVSVTKTCYGGAILCSRNFSRNHSRALTCDSKVPAAHHKVFSSLNIAESTACGTWSGVW